MLYQRWSRLLTILFVVVIAIPSQLHAEGEWKNLHVFGSIQQDILELRLDKADKRLDSLGRFNPDNLYIPFLQVRILFFRSFLPDEAAAFKRYEDAFSEKLDRVADGPRKQVHTHIALAELYLIKAFLHMRYGENFGTAWNGYKAWNTLDYAVERFPDHPLVQYGSGLLQATVGSLPENYQFFTRLIGMPGSVERGLRLMSSSLKEDAIRKNPIFYDEFAYMLCLVRYQLEDETDVLLSEFGVPVQQSSFLMYIEVLQLLKRGENDRAARKLIALPRDASQESHPYMDLITGKVLLNRQDADADKWFLRFLEKSKGQNHRVAANRYLRWHYALLGDKDRAEKHKKFASNDQAYSAMDRQAKEDLEDDFPLYLIRARLRFDGGYDEESFVILRSQVNSLGQAEPKVQLEWHYRMGRLLFREGAYSKAEDELDKAISLCSSERFNCANSWLHLGFIAEEKGEKAEARKCYQQVMNMKHFTYFEGLQQKARTGLERVEES